MIESIDSDIKDLYQKNLLILEKMGAELQEMEFPSWEYALPCYYIIANSEASSNLARYDGVRYGFRSQESANLNGMYSSTRTKAFGEEVKRRILLGTFALSSGYYDNYYLKATKIRSLISKEFKRAFERVDFILTPTTPEPAFLLGAKKDPISMYQSDRFTVTANLVGLPAISLPVGLNKQKLPIGLQIVGNFFQESLLFKLAFLIEKKVEFKKSILRRKEE